MTDRAFNPPATLAEMLREPAQVVNLQDRFPDFLYRKRSMSKKESISLHANAWPVFAVLLIVAMMVALSGCAQLAAVNAIGTAKTVEQKAFASYGTFVVFEERAAALIADRQIPVAVRKRIQAADKVAKPAADTVLTLAQELVQLRNAAETSGSTSEKLTAVTNALTGALASLAPKMTALVEAVEAVTR